MPDLPQLEDLDGPPNPARPAQPEPVPPAFVSPDPSPPRGWPNVVTTVVVWVAVAVILLYGLAGFLRVAGLYDVRQWWATTVESPSLAKLSGSTAPPAAQTTPPPAPAEGYAGPLRDLPPRSTLSNLPRFTIRDGEQHDFLTDLDAETLKRLAEVQGQLDGLGAQIGNLNQSMQALARNAGQQRQQEAAHQSRVQAELTAVRQEIAALQTVVGEVEARLKRARGGLGLAASVPVGAGGGSGRPVTGWSVKAISGDRAWLRTPKGQDVTVTAGERLKALGAVRAVDSIQGIVVMSDGRVVR